MERRNDWRILAGLTLFVTVLLFFVSQDSYIYDFFDRVDSAWFFMCGKAWMKGLVPYVDFADSKGPVLWLIYGLGYLLDHTSYAGVYWISCLWYGLIYFITFKIARLFLKDDRKALVCTLLMSFAYFNTWFHKEVRAEDFCMLFLVLSLYRVCRLMYAGPAEDREIRRTSGILGACFGVLLLIKFNIAAMQAAFILSVLWVLIREKKKLWGPLLSGLGGFAAVTVPFVVYFLIQGNFSAFLVEYFVRTTQTVNNPSFLNWVKEFLLEWSDLCRADIGAWLLLLFLGGLAFAQKEKGPYRWMPLAVSLFFFVVTMRHHRVGWILYYFNSCSFLLIFLVIFVVRELGSLSGRPEPKAVVPVTAAVTFVLVSVFNFFALTNHVFAFGDAYGREVYYKVNYVMSQVKSPTLINAYLVEQGYGMPSEVLPAGKYWVEQGGMTPRMMREHEQLILSGKADFILAPYPLISEDGRITWEQLLESGYKELFRTDYLVLLTKWDNLDVNGYVPPSYTDVLLRRLPFLKVLSR